MTPLSLLAGRTVSALSAFAKHLAEEERAGCFTPIVILLACSSSLSLPRGILGWSVVCDSGISSSYSLSFRFHIISCRCLVTYIKLSFVASVTILSSSASSNVIKTAAVAIKVKQPALSHQRNHGNMQK